MDKRSITNTIERCQLDLNDLNERYIKNNRLFEDNERVKLVHKLDGKSIFGIINNAYISSDGEIYYSVFKNVLDENLSVRSMVKITNVLDYNIEKLK